MKSTDPPVVISENFRISRSALWKAITVLEQMREWFFEDIPAFEARVGFETSFAVKAPSMVFTHVWKIVEVIPEQKIVYDWSYSETNGRGQVSFELEELTEGTKLTLTNLTIEDWPTDIPEFKSESAEAGWNFFIKESLKTYLTNK